ncbi:hypothetical protein Ciccas_013624, partial [Cichlidogyrus casuarinus]
MQTPKKKRYQLPTPKETLPGLRRSDRRPVPKTSFDELPEASARVAVAPKYRKIVAMAPKSPYSTRAKPGDKERPIVLTSSPPLSPKHMVKKP